MKKILLSSAIGLSILLSGCSKSCSEADLKAKVEAVTSAMTQLASTNPEKMQEVSKKLMEASQKFQGADSMAEACAFYDELLAEIKK